MVVGAPNYLNLKSLTREVYDAGFTSIMRGLLIMWFKMRNTGRLDFEIRIGENLIINRLFLTRSFWCM